METVSIITSIEGEQITDVKVYENGIAATVEFIRMATALHSKPFTTIDSVYTYQGSEEFQNLDHWSWLDISEATIVKDK